MHKGTHEWLQGTEENILLVRGQRATVLGCLCGLGDCAPVMPDCRWRGSQCANMTMVLQVGGS